MQIAQLGEKQLIQRLLKRRDKTLKTENCDLIQSYRDDAALCENSCKYSVFSTDMLIESHHFPVGMTPFEMGAKTVSVNVSDIIAMNAKPTAIVISLALPGDFSVDDFDALVDGILYKCNEYDITLIGGDINEADEVITSATAIGEVDGGVRFLNNAHPGDIIATTGSIGDVAGGFDLIYGAGNVDISDSLKDELMDSVFNPKLPFKTAKYLRKHPCLVTSMSDITDGLASELGCLCENNTTCSFKIYEDMIPYDKCLQTIADANHKHLYEYLFYFGEEFELLLTLNSSEYEKHKDNLSDVTPIGEVVEDVQNRVIIVDSNGNESTLKIRGYEHLK